MLLAAETQRQTWSAAYLSDPCHIFHDSTTFQTPAPLHSPVQSQPIQLVRNNYLHHPLAHSPTAVFRSMPDHNLPQSQRMVHPTVHDPFFPANSLYEAETDSGGSGTVTSVTDSGCPETDHSFIGRHLSAPVCTRRLTYDNYAFQNATLTATTEGTPSPQDSFAQIQSPANDSIAISPRIPSLDAYTTEWESTVLPAAHDPSSAPTGPRSHIPLPMRRHKAIAGNIFQRAMSSSASREHATDDPQSVRIRFHQNVGKAIHYLRHVNSKQCVCIW